MHFIPPEIERYAEMRTTDEPAYLSELAAETRANVDQSMMLSGHLVGRFLSTMSKLLAPKLVIDIGTFTGYSSLCMAEGLAPGGAVHTIDINEMLAPMVDRYLRKAGYHDRVFQHLAPAAEVVPRIEGVIDMVFIDADKPGYAHYFDLVIDRVRPGGLIIADNVLWDGRVAAPIAEHDERTAALYAYAEKVHRDPRVESMLLPVRDGLLVSRKR
ncbi:MAG TPA: O-methyltransferase [Flavobacteriales bacterium]|nr:O-methyltransferase [Flavobacteriales bacterium]